MLVVVTGSGMLTAVREGRPERILSPVAVIESGVLAAASGKHRLEAPSSVVATGSGVLTAARREYSVRVSYPLVVNGLELEAAAGGEHP